MGGDGVTSGTESLLSALSVRAEQLSAAASLRPLTAQECEDVVNVLLTIPGLVKVAEAAQEITDWYRENEAVPSLDTKLRILWRSLSAAGLLRD